MVAPLYDWVKTTLAPALIPTAVVVSAIVVHFALSSIPYTAEAYAGLWQSGSDLVGQGQLWVANNGIRSVLQQPNLKFLVEASDLPWLRLHTPHSQTPSPLS